MCRGDSVGYAFCRNRKVFLNVALPFLFTHHAIAKCHAMPHMHHLRHPQCCLYPVELLLLLPNYILYH